MVIVLRFGQKKDKAYKCCVCLEKFEIVKDSFYIDKEYMEEYHICNECLKLEGIKNKINEMVKFYRDDLNKQPRTIDKVIAFFDKDSFSYVVVKAWKKAHKDIRMNVDKEQERRKKFIEVKINN